MATCLISFGSNQGDRAATYGEVVDQLVREPGTVECIPSGLWKTRPIGGPSQSEWFANGVIRLESTLPPAELFGKLMQLETVLGRRRTTRWGPRTVDLDLLLVDGFVGTLSGVAGEATWVPGRRQSAPDSEPGSDLAAELAPSAGDLVIPHPRMSFRRFVLEPANQVAGQMLHPVCGSTIAELLSIVSTRPNQIALSHSVSQDVRPLLQRTIEIARRKQMVLSVVGHPQDAANIFNGERDWKVIPMVGQPDPHTARQLKLVVSWPEPGRGRPADQWKSPGVAAPHWRGPRLELNPDHSLAESAIELMAAIESMLSESVIGRLE